MLASGRRHRCCLRLALGVHAGLPSLGSMVATLTSLSRQVLAESLFGTILGPLLIASSS